MTISVEIARKRGLRKLIAMQRAAFRPLYQLYRDEGSPYLRGRKEHAEWLKRTDRYVYQICADGKCCGGIVAFERENGVFYLARLYILPNMQGKGVGAQAIALLEAELPQARKWSVDFPADQPQNRRCYEKAGYRDTGLTRQINERLTLAIYEKEVN
ncbi:MAG: GNAT family N-acetyltransferase [Oscillospiraceae bacterium]|jgi:GNAT superfamily N-acetyltransferase|nr:GNAT family N-acetyltransferase [Oscillospiraceae bacterium]